MVTLTCVEGCLVVRLLLLLVPLPNAAIWKFDVSMEADTEH